MAEIEPFGYRVYRVFLEQESRVSFDKDLSVTETLLENNKIRVEFSRETGDIERIYDKQSQKYIIDGECSAVLLDETSADTWAHEKVYLGDKVGEFNKPEFLILEDGNVRATLRVTTYCEDSVLQRDYSITHNSDIVTVNVKVDFREKHRTMKFAFPVTFEDVVAEIPYGTIRREKGSGEEVCGSWFTAGGLCVANDSKYAYDTTDSEVRLTVLRSAVYADAGGKRDAFCEYIDMGIHEFTYQLFPYRSNSDSERRAGELNCELRTVMESFHTGDLPEQLSLFEGRENHIIVTAIKQAEDDDAAIVRFFEAEGLDGNVSMKIFDKEIRTTISHNEIKTFKTDGTEVNLIEWQ